MNYDLKTVIMECIAKTGLNVQTAVQEFHGTKDIKGIIALSK